MKTKKLIITLTDRTPQGMLSGTGATIRYCNCIIPKSIGDV